MLLPVLLVAAAQQPVAGVVFVLDGVLIGAGDQDYLALAGLAGAAVLAVGAALGIAPQRRRGAGLPGAGRAGGRGRVRGRRGAGDRPARGPGRAVTGIQPLADGPL